MEWKRKIKDRQTPARDIGVYNAYNDEKWNDELLVGAKESESEELVEALLKDTETVVEGDEAQQGPVQKETVEKPLPRITEADKAGDLRSLNRSLARTLYLVVRGKEGRWGFPSAGLVGKESLHIVGQFRPKGKNLQEADAATGRGKNSGSSWGDQHEHLGDRQCTCWSFQPQLPASKSRSREEVGAIGGKDVLHEGADYGWPGGPQGQSIRAGRFQVASKR